MSGTGGLNLTTAALFWESERLSLRALEPLFGRQQASARLEDEEEHLTRLQVPPKPAGVSAVTTGRGQHSAL